MAFKLQNVLDWGVLVFYVERDEICTCDVAALMLFWGLGGHKGSAAILEGTAETAIANHQALYIVGILAMLTRSCPE